MTRPVYCPKHTPAEGKVGCLPGANGCKACDKLQALADLRALLPPGTTVYTILRSVSRSGMSRVIDPVVMGKDGPRSIRGYVRDILGWSMSKDHDGLKVGGCGMDMGFHLVYSLSSALYRDGVPCTERDGCPSNDHSNGDRSYAPHMHTDGGYALTQRWL